MDKTKYVFIKYIPTFSAGGEGRTPTGLLPQGPKPCASANFATPACQSMIRIIISLSYSNAQLYF